MKDFWTRRGLASKAAVVAILIVVALIVNWALRISVTDDVDTEEACTAIWSAEAETEPRPAGSPGQLEFAGHRWNVRSYPGGPTSVGTFSAEQVSVRQDGALVLQQEALDGEWLSAEVYSDQEGFGYGVYRWAVESDLQALDPNVVLGFFIYEDGAPGNREIDIEATRWGDRDRRNMHVTRHEPDQLLSQSWELNRSVPTEHGFHWSLGKITWCSRDVDGTSLFATTLDTELEPGDERVHMNLWIYGGVEPGTETRVVVSDFTFAPA